MDCSSTFFSDSIQYNRNDAVELLDDRDMSKRGDDYRNAPSSADPDEISIDAQLAQIHSPDPLPTNSTNATTPEEPATRRDEKQPATSNFNSRKVDSPGLSNGSSETPKTRSSQRTATPEDPEAYLEDKLNDGPKTTSFQPSNQPTKRTRQQKQQESKDTGQSGERVKRTKFLERNRVAATKCRQKKKEWVSDLEETRFGLESQHNHLQMEYTSLKNEITQIKSQLMDHASCNDPNIDKWIENEAKRFVLGTSERYDQMLAGLNTAPGRINRQASIASASGYPAVPDPELPSATPTQRSSISFPPGDWESHSPVFYRSDLAPNISETPALDHTEEPYPLDAIPNTMSPNLAGFEDVSMANGAFQDSSMPKG